MVIANSKQLFWLKKAESAHTVFEFGRKYAYTVPKGGAKMRNIFLIVWSGSFGLLTSAGVFTVLVAIGLIPRFAGKTHTAGRVFLYEEMVIGGSIAGAIASIFSEYIKPAEFLREQFAEMTGVWELLGIAGQAVFGVFAGMFVGCLALAIAEMLDSIPIFARRVSFRHGLGMAVLGIALGKLCGSLGYFVYELHDTAK